MRFGRKGKLSPRYVGPFPITKRVGEVAYRLSLPAELAGVHSVFHVSQLRRYVADPSHVLDFSQLKVAPDLSVPEYPVRVIDRRVQQLRRKQIPLVKVIWQNRVGGEATWEREDEMQEQFPYLFD